VPVPSSSGWRAAAGSGAALAEIDPGSAPGQATWSFEGPESDEARVPLSQYLRVLKRRRWRILGFVAACTLAAVIVSARLTPLYESTATVDFDRQTPPGVVGPEAQRGASNDADQFMATQIKLVESDPVLRPVDQQFRLRELERQSMGASGAEDTPVTLRDLRVTRPPNTYLLLISYRSPDPKLASEVANAISKAYLDHTYDVRLHSSANLSGFMERQLDELRAKMERSGQALAGFERELNVINPEAKTDMLSSRLMQLNTELTGAEAERLKREAAFESVRGGALEAAFATPQGEELRRLAERRNEAREHLADLKTHYGINHPEYRRAQARVIDLEAAIETTRQEIAARVKIEFEESARRETLVKRALSEAKEEFDRVNARSFEYQALKREAEADKRLYEELFRKVKEAGINAGFENNAIRIADAARPALLPVFPNIGLNAMLVLLFSALAAGGAAIVSDLLDNTVRDPEQVSRTLPTEVIGSLPLVKRRGVTGIRATAAPGRRESESDLSGFGESVRALRNSIFLGTADPGYRSLLVTSAMPGEGKTTTAANLAAANAEHGGRTLLIDGDLRRPSLHRVFDLAGADGLLNVLLDEISWRAALTHLDWLPGLSILPAGSPSRRTAELIGRSLAELIDDASREFDLVILDAPPMLGFAEPLEMAAAVDGVIVVARAGRTSRKAVGTVLGTLHRVRARTVGLVLNEVHQELSDSYAYYGRYRSYYRTRSQAAT
jgi:polysaccharide biosynthesis transport protein